MNLYEFLPLSSFFFISFVGLYTWVQRRDKPVNQAFIQMTIVFSGWAFIEFLLWSAGIKMTWVLPLLKMQAIFWGTTGFVVYNFISALLNRKNDWLFYALFVFLLIFWAMVVFTDWIIAGVLNTRYGFEEEQGFLALPCILLSIITPTVFSLLLLLKKIFQIPKGLEKAQYKLVFSGMLFPFILGASTDVLLPVVLGRESPIQVASSIPAVFMGFMFVAINKYQLLNFKAADIAEKLFFHLQNGILILSEEGQVLQLNPGARQILNVPHQKIEEIQLTELIENYKNTISYNNYETRLNSSEILRYISISQSNLALHGFRLGTIIFLKDITEKFLYEKTLREQRDRTQMYLDVAGVMLMAIDLNLNITMMNRHGCEILGDDEATVVGRNLVSAYVPEGNDAFVEKMIEKSRALRNSEILEFDGPIKAASGQLKLISWKVTPLTVQNEQAGYFCSGEDVTEKNQFENALRTSEKIYLTLFNHIPDPIAIFNKKTLNFVVCNASFLRKYGYSLEELKQMTPLNLHPPNEIERVKQRIQIRNNDKPFVYIPRFIMFR